MFLSKKIAKLQSNPLLLRSNESKARKERIKDPNKKLRCQFAHIPLPTKFLHPCQPYLLYGDLPIMELNGRMVSDCSFYNEFKLYPEVIVAEIYDSKVMIVKTAPRQDRELPDWHNLVNKLKTSEDPILEDWARSIQVFSQKYSKVMSRQSRKKSKSGPRRKFFADVTAETELKKQKLFQEYSCMQLKFRLKKHENQLVEIIFNEKLINDTGHTLEEFSGIVQQEGIPQLSFYEESTNDDFIKALMEKYFTIEDDGFELPEVVAPLIVKGNFVKDVKYNVHFLMNYETNTFGMDVILALTTKGELYVREKTPFTSPLNEDFLTSKISQEEETSNLLTKYYNVSINQTYMNRHRTCTIRELSPEESSLEEEEEDDMIIVKKDEDF